MRNGVFRRRRLAVLVHTNVTSHHCRIHHDGRQRHRRNFVADEPAVVIKTSAAPVEARRVLRARVEVQRRLNTLLICVRRLR